MTLLIRKNSSRGMNELYGLPDKRLKSLSMGLVSLDGGDRFGESLNGRQAMVYPLIGTITLRGQKFDLGEMAGAITCNELPPTAAYCPQGVLAMKARAASEVLIVRAHGFGKGGKAALLPIKVDGNSVVLNNIDNGKARAASGVRLIAKDENPGTAIEPAAILGEEWRKAEGIYFFQGSFPTTALQMAISDASGTEVEKLEVSTGDAVILPAGHSMKVAKASAPVACIWGACLNEAT